MKSIFISVPLLPITTPYRALKKSRCSRRMLEMAWQLPHPSIKPQRVSEYSFPYVFIISSLLFLSFFSSLPTSLPSLFFLFFCLSFPTPETRSCYVAPPGLMFTILLSLLSARMRQWRTSCYPLRSAPTSPPYKRADTAVPSLPPLRACFAFLAHLSTGVYCIFNISIIICPHPHSRSGSSGN